MKLLDRCVDKCLDLVYPPRCVFCDALLAEGEQYFCRSCGEQAPVAEGMDAVRLGTYVDRCVAPLYYEGIARESFLDYKFHEKTWRAGTYAALLEPYVKEAFPDVDVVTWSPLSRRSQRDRGYDQSALIARALAKRLELPCTRLLDKVRHTGQQSRLSLPEERRANVQGAYAIRQGAAVRGRRILLVDDVITTGSTMEECGRVLRAAGAEAVHGAAIAQAGHGGREPEEAAASGAD